MVTMQRQALTDGARTLVDQAAPVSTAIAAR